MGLKPDGSITISFSELMTYISCPYQHKLKYLSGKEIREKKDVLAYGTAMHVGLQALWQTDLDSAKRLYRHKLLAEFRELPLAETFDLYEEKGLALLEAFYASGYANLKLIDIEFQLREQLTGNVYFSGFIDVLLWDPKRNKVVIADFKTTERGWTKKQREGPEKRLQLLFYKYFIHHIFEFPYDEIDCEFIFLRGNDLTVEEFRISSTEREAEASFHVILEALRMIYLEKKNNYKNPFSCFFCMFNRSCDKMSATEDFVDTSKLLRILS